MADFGTVLNPNNTSLNLYCNSINTVDSLPSRVVYTTVGSNITNTYPINTRSLITLWQPEPAYSLEFKNIIGVSYGFNNGNLTSINFNGSTPLKAYYIANFSGFITNSDAPFTIRVLYDNSVRNELVFNPAVRTTDGFFSISTGFRITDNNTHSLKFEIDNISQVVGIVGATVVLDQY